MVSKHFLRGNEWSHCFIGAASIVIDFINSNKRGNRFYSFSSRFWIVFFFILFRRILFLFRKCVCFMVIKPQSNAYTKSMFDHKICIFLSLLAESKKKPVIQMSFGSQSRNGVHLEFLFAVFFVFAFFRDFIQIDFFQLCSHCLIDFFEFAEIKDETEERAQIRYQFANFFLWWNEWMSFN